MESLVLFVRTDEDDFLMEKLLLILIKNKCLFDIYYFTFQIAGYFINMGRLMWWTEEPRSVLIGMDSSQEKSRK